MSVEIAWTFTSVRRVGAQRVLLCNVIVRSFRVSMRRSEILRAEWADIEWSGRTLSLRQTKNGHPRLVPLSGSTLALLKRHAQDRGRERLIFPITANALRLCWVRIVRRSGIRDLRFHDLRHEAISTFFESGLSLPEVALISGNRDPRQLMRYTHLDAARITRKLEGPSGWLGDTGASLSGSEC